MSGLSRVCVPDQPQTANEVIEQELDSRGQHLGEVLQADVLAFNGGLVFGQTTR